ncbi:MAG: zinc ribbon domain-containing protein, partial [Solirubrobacterales bacterium]
MVDESKSAQSELASGPVGAGRQTEEKGQAAGVNASAAPANPAVAGVDAPTSPADPGFLERGGLRRRLRFLRKTRELAYRDLGGLVFEMHRLGQRREDLLASKLATLARIDTELRAIEETLRQRRGVTVLREAGVTACPRCAAIHGSEDRFCPACGFSMGSHADRPIAAPAAAAPAAAAPIPQPEAPALQSTPSLPEPPRPPSAAPAPPPAPPR